ncbi:MAG TPA: DUF5665 domain-containing protein [Fimbriimonadaceae bacterium]|nr:DUF5665 domain-containing protein [Fimbriimonadaceae bacterium]
MVEHELAPTLARLERTLSRLEDHLNPSLRRRFLQGMVSGFGTVVGATLLVSLIVWVAQPFTQIDRVGPALERVLDDLLKKRSSDQAE